MHLCVFENTFYLFKKCVLAFVCKEICSHCFQFNPQISYRLVYDDGGKDKKNMKKPDQLFK